MGETDELTGAQIKALREKKGWNATELAHRAGLTLQQLRDYETGVRSPRGKVRARLLKAFAGETEPPPQLTRRPELHGRTPRVRAKPSTNGHTPAPPHHQNGTAPGAATIILDAADFAVTGDGSTADAARLEHAFAALESLWRITGALVELKLPPGRHRITPAIANLVLGQQG